MSGGRRQQIHPQCQMTVVFFSIAFVSVVSAQSVNISRPDFGAFNTAVFDFARFARNQSAASLFASFACRRAMLTATTDPYTFFNDCEGCFMFNLDCDVGGRVRRVAVGDEQRNPFIGSGEVALYATATISSTIAQFGALTSLTISLPGPIPSSVAALTALSSFVYSAQTSTTLSSTVGLLAQLESLSIQAAALTALPTALGLLTKLTNLAVSAANVTSLPAELGALKALKAVSIRVKSGQLPAGWAGLKVSSFDVGQSGLTGAIPLFVFNGADNTCTLRQNSFDSSVSLCPRGCACDNDIVPQPLPTLPPPPTPSTSAAASTTTTPTTVAAPTSMPVDIVAHVTLTVAASAAAIAGLIIVAFVITCIVLRRAIAKRAVVAPVVNEPSRPYQSVPPLGGTPSDSEFQSARDYGHGNLVHPQSYHQYGQ